jgi:hypothetical protein
MTQYDHVKASCRRAMTVAAAVFALHGCSSDPPTGEIQAPATTAETTTMPIAQLPFVDGASATQVLGELLEKPTALGETTALHVRLPPPNNPQLADSLVRVIGPPDSPQVLFRSDALAQLGVIGKSPGKDFFTTFATLSPDELGALQQNAAQIAQGALGDTTRESLVFDGRSPIGRTSYPPISGVVFRPGVSVPIRGCSIRPVSTLAGWGKSLFITDPAVVQDPARTWDPCTGAGTKGGAWTFDHLMREMAIGSATTAEDFVTKWLSQWLNTYPVNSDNVAARTQMFNQVIQPWATASGVTATLGFDAAGKRVVNLSGPLKLGIAPFRLVSIVNRIDLGKTTTGGGLYGPVTGLPETAGELRFIFDVVQPNPWGAGSEATCGKKRFTTIFEYGVPGEGCRRVVSWAKQWTSLLAFPGFTPGYRAQLQAMTESVVRHGADPAKGNQNAINQIRTNEIALTSPWELREFRLTDEDPIAGTDTPSSGLLRAHTVAMTTNDGAFYAAGPDATIDHYVTSNAASICASTNDVPYRFDGRPFRGGNALVAPATLPPAAPSFAFHWNVNAITMADPFVRVCARHQFSTNTCHGCHHDDTATPFTHIDPLSPIPVPLSSFLTGGGPGFMVGVPDSQFGPPPGGLRWWFADLERRFQRLIELSHCTSCITIPFFVPKFLDPIIARGPVPVDPDPTVQLPFKVGPITDLAVVRELLDVRAQFAAGTRDESSGFIRPGEVMPD